MAESEVQKLIRLEASKRGIYLWRNNCGMAFNGKGQPVRFGLANESAQVSKNFKSSDLIGLTPYQIRPEDVGRIVGIFTSIECKRSGWVFTGTEREQAQMRWIDLINKFGGIGKFVKDVTEL